MKKDMTKLCCIKIIHSKINMADSAPERLLKEIKANSENPAFWPELL